MKAATLVLVAVIFALPLFGQSSGTQPQSAPSAQAQTQAPATPAAAGAPPAPSVAPVPPAAPTNSQLVVPAETTIPLILDSTVNSRTAYVGQAIYCETIFPITAGNHMVIPIGTAVKGSVTQVIRPGRVKGRAQIGLRFDELVLPNGTTRPLRGTLSGFGTTGKDDFNPKEGKIKGQSSKGQDAENIARTTVPGAGLGSIVGAAKGDTVKGLGIGAAAGAATGLIWVFATRGQDVVLPRGTNLELQLIAPLSFYRDEIEPASRYDQGPALLRRDYGDGPGA